MSAFDINYLDRRYEFIDAVPEELFELVLRQTSGSLEERTASVAALRDGLLSGELPEKHELSWPSAEVVELVWSFLEETELPSFCKAQPEIVDALIGSILGELTDLEGNYEAGVQSCLRELQRIAEERLRASQNAKSLEGEEQDDANEEPPVELSADDYAELRDEAEEVERKRALDAMRKGLHQAWAERTAAYKQVLEVFGSLSGILGRGMDYARGLVRSQGWSDIVRLRALMEQLPQLQELIATLGRMHISDDDSPPVMETIFESIRHGRVDEVEVRTPLAPMETRGVRRSNDLSRLLPAEALNLAHPRLRTLFYARMHEHALATYLVDGVLPQKIDSFEDVEEEQTREREKPPLKRGPIIACLDTSGSMHGTPEQVAKALVLEALRVAREQGRPCYLIAFSGPGQTEALELSLDMEGLGDLYAFLGRSFHGGTDLVAPMNEAMALLDTQNWEKADILLVSDGEFAVPESLRRDLNSAREESGLRVHGVLIASRRSEVMARICDEMHAFESWDAMRG
ncbi:VWA domain-containing protein [Lujinxingia vulgaris]|nr:VWA domain-containing protein [Lujinxingia vulgaris]